jgi:hypothetical protein
VGVGRGCSIVAGDKGKDKGENSGKDARFPGFHTINYKLLYICPFISAVLMADTIIYIPFRLKKIEKRYQSTNFY